MAIDQPIPLIVGALLYGVIMWDVLATTLSMHRGGPVTSALTRLIDRAISAPPATLGENTNESSGVRFFATYSNLVLTGTLFATWFTGLVVSLSLVLTSSPSSIEETGAGIASSWLERVYFVGASITTAGFGDYVPGSDGWRIFTVATAASGLIVTSLGISYVINLVGAVLHQRQLARAITDLGSRPRDILAAHYDGETFAPFGALCTRLADPLLRHTQNHLAYPMIHYVRADDDRDCLPAAVAVLDEALTVALIEIPRDVRTPINELMAARRAVTAYLESVRDIVPGDRPDAPPYPHADWLRVLWDMTPANGRRELSDRELHALAERRRLLRSAVQSQGLAWERLADSLGDEVDEGIDFDLLPRLAEATDRGIAALRK